MCFEVEVEVEVEVELEVEVMVGELRNIVASMISTFIIFGSLCVVCVFKCCTCTCCRCCCWYASPSSSLREHVSSLSWIGSGATCRSCWFVMSYGELEGG